jgi:isoquinoline 1-oxidoreductase subunit beta
MLKRIDRRRFIRASVRSACALTIGFSMGGCRPRSDPFAPDSSIAGEINAWLVVTGDDKVVIRVARAEMGQGVWTSLAMIVAEELECRWEDVRVEAADVNRSVRSKRLYGRFRTDASSAVRASRQLLQQVGANARMRLLKAAANRWSVDAAECVAREGRITHTPSGRSFRFGELAAAAAAIDASGDKIVIKNPSQFRLMGRSTMRLDVVSKSTGTGSYGIDIRVPGMVYAAVLHCPTLGGVVRRIKSGDGPMTSPARQVFALDDAVVAVAEGFWQARSALHGVEVEWGLRVAEPVSSAALRESFLGALDQPATVATNRGDALAVLDRAGNVLEAIYDVPYLAHACMEPLNCTASVTDERVDIWVGTQDPEAVVELARAITGRDVSQINVHPQWLGGGFGRRISTDYVAQALKIAQKVRKPVQMIWTREQDMRSGLYRPMAAWRLKASVSEGSIEAVFVRVVADSILQRHWPGDMKGGIDPTSLAGLSDSPYGWGHLRIESRNMSGGVPTWFWRSVGDSQNAFAVESFVDELALRAGADPISIRRRLLRDKPRHLGVLAAMEQKIDVTEKLPPGQGRGIAIHENSNTVVGQVVDVRASATGVLTVSRVVTFVDCGNVVNPSTVEAQIEGAVVCRAISTPTG